MSDWILFENATYLVEKAFLVADDLTAALLEKTSIEVFTDRGGKKRLKGSGLVENMNLVELLDENDDLDLILDLGGEFKYLMKTPKIAAGKVFSPGVKSRLQFDPTVPWEQIPESDFSKLVDALKIL